MTSQTSNNWLIPFRKKTGHTQVSLTAAMDGVDKKTIQRWERCEQTTIKPPFDKLAKILETTEQTLKDAFESAFAKKYPNLAGIKTTSITQALNECTPMGLTPKILAAMNINDNEIEEAVKKIKTWFMDGEINSLIQCFNPSFVATVPTITQSNDLDLIEQLLGAIAIAATIPHDSTTKKSGGYFDAHNVEQPWSIRLAINASITSLSGKGMSGITASTPAQLDVARALEIQETKQDDVWLRVHEIIKGTSEEFFMDKEPCPPLSENEGNNLPGNPQYSSFRKYCKNKIDIHIQQTQYDERHYFAYSLQEEPEDVRQLMMELLPSLKIFICTDKQSYSPLLRLDEYPLQGWIASNLYMITERREQLKQSNKEDSKMSSKNNSGNSVEISSTDQGKIEVTVNQAIQNNQVTENQELISLLQKILREIEDSEGDHRLLRNDVNDILNPLNETGQAPKEGKGWLQKGISALKPGTALITAVTKAVELYGKL